MGNNKINEIGKKLDIETSELAIIPFILLMQKWNY